MAGESSASCSIRRAGPHSDMDIPGWRRKIDEIDQKLVRLLNERARCAVEIGKIKRQNGLPVRDAGREEEVLRRVVEGNPGPLTPDGIRKVFEEIVEQGRNLEHSLFEKLDSEAKQR